MSKPYREDQEIEDGLSSYEFRYKLASDLEEQSTKSTLSDAEIEKIVKIMNLHDTITKQQEFNMDIKSKAIEIFEPLDFVKQICYESEYTNSDNGLLLVIYEHDDFEHSIRTICDGFLSLERQFPNMHMDLLFAHTSEIGPGGLNNTITIFKRKD